MPKLHPDAPDQSHDLDTNARNITRFYLPFALFSSFRPSTICHWKMSLPPTIPENPIVLDLTTTYGSLLVGCFLSAAMWGVSSLQTFIYFAHSDDDPTRMKILIGLLWMADTANEILTLKSVWKVLIQQYGRIGGIAVTQPELMHKIWVGAMFIFVVQIFFIRRIYLFSKSKVLAGVMILAAAYQIVVVVPWEIMNFANGLKTVTTGHTSKAIEISIRAISAGLDIAIAACMLFSLLYLDTGHFARTQRMIQRLVIVTINTGLWTAIFAVIEFVLLLVYKDGLQFTIIEFPLASLYFSTLLANLNTREYIRTGRQGSGHNPAALFQGRSGGSSGQSDSFRLEKLSGRSDRTSLVNPKAGMQPMADMDIGPYGR